MNRRQLHRAIMLMGFVLCGAFLLAILVGGLVAPAGWVYLNGELGLLFFGPATLGFGIAAIFPPDDEELADRFPTRET